MRPVADLRDRLAKADAIERYDTTYEWFAEKAQTERDPQVRSTLAGAATLFLVAADAERKDPAPREFAVHCCFECIAYVRKVARG